MVRIWYDLDTGEILDVEILYCWDDGSGGGSGGGGSNPPPPNTPECSDDQVAIAEEYNDSNWPCDKFVDAVTSGAGTHGHATGYLDPSYTSGRDAVFAQVGLHGISPWITSDWRCPEGNSSVGGVAGSQHVQGTAGDFTASGFDAAMHEQFRLAGIAAGRGWSSPYGSGGYTTHIHIDWR